MDVLAAVVLHLNDSNNAIVCACALAASHTVEEDKVRKPKGRYLRNGTLDLPMNSIWKREDLLGDDLEFLHFTGFSSRASFDSLVDLCCVRIERRSPQKRYYRPKVRNLKRRDYQPRDVTAMTLKYLTSKAELKDLSVQFGAHESTYIQYVHLGMWCLIEKLCDHRDSRVYWDRSTEGLVAAAEVTKDFLDCPNIVAMLDGDKIKGRHPMDPVLQNRDLMYGLKRYTEIIY